MGNTIKNIKIPYPKEGIIRTAALDDTVSPEDSAQIGVNINFDRVGAWQTRKGIAEYADALTAPIKNFGTLNNSIIPGGYDQMIKFSATDNFTSHVVGNIASVKVDDTHILLFWRNEGDGLGYAQVVEVDLDTGELTPKGTALNFDADGNDYNACYKVDATHFVNMWQGGVAQHGYAQTFAVDLNTYAVTAVGTPLEFYANLVAYNTITQVDADHFLAFWSAIATGRTQVLKVDLGTYAVTAIGSPLTFDAVNPALSNSCGQVDADHYINFWDSGGVGTARVFAVNLTTYAVTTAAVAFTYDAASGSNNACQKMDATHFINFWTSSGSDGVAKVFAISLSTYVITAAGASTTFESGTSRSIASVSAGDGEHFAVFWEATGNIGYGQLAEVDTGTFAITMIPYAQSLGDGASGIYNSAVLIGTYKIVNFWKKADGTGVGSIFELQGAIEFFNWLYAQQGDGDVLNWDNPGWTTRRSGLQTTAKARFMQYLNRIWMVNGNVTIGDPVMTSDGGNFDTTLVPDGFPPGDFIQGGFEGRVWVADKNLDILYFTDIVQFSAPHTYTLTYDADTNFIKNFSPQNGQSMTALFTTPRALLVFKQDSIFRVYGAFSVDSYPAYNVGTYSQESIVQTKDGIYFHHSSGFYKFAYDSQPIEISRRVIDFVQAISRDNYENVLGIWDGYDAIEWRVGSVTVEGVTYVSCVMRYTISTQVWTIYDYNNFDITALIRYDDGSRINMVVGGSDI